MNKVSLKCKEKQKILNLISKFFPKKKEKTDSDKASLPPDKRTKFQHRYDTHSSNLLMP